jgi:hypothetical protein
VRGQADPRRAVRGRATHYLAGELVSTPRNLLRGSPRGKGVFNNPLTRPRPPTLMPPASFRRRCSGSAFACRIGESTRHRCASASLGRLQIALPQRITSPSGGQRLAGCLTLTRRPRIFEGARGRALGGVSLTPVLDSGELVGGVSFLCGNQRCTTSKADTELLAPTTHLVVHITTCSTVRGPGFQTNSSSPAWPCSMPTACLLLLLHIRPRSHERDRDRDRQAAK